MVDKMDQTSDTDESTSDTGGLDGIVEAAVNAQDDAPRTQSNEDETSPSENEDTAGKEDMIEVRSNGYVEQDNSGLDPDTTLTPETQTHSESSQTRTQDTADTHGDDDIIAPEPSTPKHQTSGSSSSASERTSSRADSIDIVDDAEFVGVDTADDADIEDAESEEFKTDIDEFEFQRDRQNAGSDEVPARGDAVFLGGADKHEEATVEDDDPRRERRTTEQETDEDEDDESSFIVGS